ncbi:hypothetical protein Pint_23866 [Pistacia integerrima]|uniref:Uncharacterized protein n=1 Tax=Pistacia integerrima TaxID=434235 RepID=A0ACC0YKE2_9ROSI|nr:hypothetical protein Pint_23866 [Pistacia integerrima]
MSKPASCSFDMWQQDGIAPPSHHTGKFYILLRVYFIVEYTPQHYKMNVYSKKSYGYLERSDLVDDLKLPETISRMMKLLPVTEEDKEKIIKIVGSKAKLMDCNDSNAGRDVISAVMSLGIFYKQKYNQEVELAWATRLGKSLGECVPAMELAVMDLNKVVFEKNCCLESQCGICLEGFCEGEEITRLPCSHDFHGGCIVKWLKKSHLCPFCRFPLQVCGETEALCPFKEEKMSKDRVYRKPRRRVGQPWLRSRPYGRLNIVDPLG